MPEGGTLILDARQENGSIHIQITDTGLGMSSETQESLFIPFYSTKNNSMGYGLFETQRIISEHQGTISIDSALNKGTQVNIQFPILRLEKVEMDEMAWFYVAIIGLMIIIRSCTRTNQIDNFYGANNFYCALL